MELSGWVKILDENGNFAEVRYLGEVPVGCKPGRVLQIDSPPSPSASYDGTKWVEPATAADSIRFQRDELLRQSDWTQLADSPADKELWAAYRQELRDITMQPGFPDAVVWPLPPIG